MKKSFIITFLSFFTFTSFATNENASVKDSCAVSDVTKEVPVSITTTVYSDADMEAHRNIDGEQPVMPANINIGTSKLTLFGYAQTAYTYEHSNKQTKNAFDMTRIILMANAELTKQLSFFLMFDANSGQLHEYYGQYAFSPQLKVRIGQFKQPYTLENIYPPTILDNISFNKSVLYMTGIATDPGVGPHTARDAGIMITGDLLPKDGRPQFNYQLGVFNGTGRNIKENNNQKSVMGMLNYMPVKELLFSGSFAAGTSKAENGRKDFEDNPIYAAGENYHRLRLALGAEAKTKPVYFRTEYMYGKDAKTPMHGFYADAEVHIVPKKFDIVADFDYLNRNANTFGNESVNTYMAGVQYWVYKQCRILSQFVHTSPKHGAVKNEWITQFQIAF